MNDFIGTGPNGMAADRGNKLGGFLVLSGE